MTNINIQTDKYILKNICQEDKENYLNLFREISMIARASEVMEDVDYDAFSEYAWQEIEKEDTIYVSVFLKENRTYVGNITISHPDSKTPEIGIEVLKKYHRQGIASESIPLATKRVMELKSVEYFLVRIYSDNEASKRLFAKIGAVRSGTEASEFSVVLEHLKELSEEEYQNYLLRNPGAKEIANARWIERYTYLPK